jgi:signal transduction histidine kinase/CheY-like chemotaxis protein
MLELTTRAILALSYFTIACALIYLVRKERTPFTGVMWLFCALLMVGGLAHALVALPFTSNLAWLASGARVAAAVVSLGAAIAFLRAIPLLLQLPTRAELSQVNAMLEQRVAVRTGDLTAANDRLRTEAGQREQAEAEVHRLNAELEARLMELQSLFKLLPVGVVIASDPSCRRIRCNETYADMLGLPPRSFSSPPAEVAETFRVVRDGRELAAHEQPMLRAIAANAPVRDFEQTIVRSDGVTIEVIANAVPIRDADGQPQGCVATFQDISAHKLGERKRLDFERKLLHSQKLESIGVLAGGIAHDFNNLLTGVLGHANFARSELTRGVTDIDPLLAQIETSAQRAAELCRQLLAYAGKGRFVVRLIDPNTAVEQAVPLLKLSIAKKVTLDLQLSSDLSPFRGDPTQISQALMNLVTNASEAIGAGVGTVTIRTERVTLTQLDLLTLTAGNDVEPGTFICISVRDTGCGITPEVLAHIFEPFFTTKFVGRGLGLAAVLGIMHGHHGAIRVASQVGAGTTIELFFPLATPPARNQTAPAAKPAQRGSVLVVDDDETVRSLAGAALARAGYAVVTAIDGEDALAKLRGDPLQFDAVLLDLTMPKLDGEDTLMALRVMAPSVPVVLTSGYSEQTVALRFVGRGLADFLAKPFLPDTLVASINSAIARTRGEQLSQS